MHIQQEPKNQHTIQSYSDTGVNIDGTTYESSLIVCRDRLISPWETKREDALTSTQLLPLLELKPEIIIIGSAKPDAYRTHPALLALNAKGIGIECLDIGGAARTFNLLLSEHRDVVVGFIL